MTKRNRLSRIAGLLYLANILCGVFAELFVRASIVVPGNAALTAKNILQSEFLFRLGFIADFGMIASFVLLGFSLYLLLESVDGKVASSMVLVVVGGASILSLNMVFQYAPLLLLKDPSISAAIPQAQLDALVLWSMGLHKTGYALAAIAYGPWLAPLGWLLHRSGWFPKPLGLLVALGSLGHMAGFVVTFLFPAWTPCTQALVGACTAIPEFALCLWLLVRGAAPAAAPSPMAA